MKYTFNGFIRLQMPEERTTKTCEFFIKISRPEKQREKKTENP